MKVFPIALHLMMIRASLLAAAAASSERQKVAAYTKKFGNKGVYRGDVCAIITSSEEGMDAKVLGLCDGQKIPSFASEDEVPKNAQFYYNQMPRKGLISVNCGGKFTYVSIVGSKADPMVNYSVKAKKGKAAKLTRTALYSVCKFVETRLTYLPMEEITIINDGNNIPKISMSELRADQAGEEVADLLLEKTGECTLKLILLSKDMEKLRSIFSLSKAKFFEIIRSFFGMNNVCLHLTPDPRMKGEIFLAQSAGLRAQILADHSGNESTITCSSISEKGDIFAKFFSLSNPFLNFCKPGHVDGAAIKTCNNGKAADFCGIALSLRKRLVNRLSLSV